MATNPAVRIVWPKNCSTLEPFPQLLDTSLAGSKDINFYVRGGACELFDSIANHTVYACDVEIVGLSDMVLYIVVGYAFH